MVRSPNLQPNQVAFRVPPNCNKFDIHSYLTNIYGVNVQEVRTMNYATEHKRSRNGKTEVVQSAYKKAIVTINEPFVWPAAPEWCALDEQQHKLGTKAAGRKLKGWRFRASPEDKDKQKQVNQDLMAREQGSSGKK
ncbi:ribosomal protein L23-domain-containing protein [Radiomyces spectabilis]|uniref:ribosomal protein L23-domain-containing protein n=1 Tax=Radiomyces spectabilis TaxID=64574 RepID=UPI002220480D|nr:ribosomal protein L23-domain-containing protein [Radiomyces spectabilis]KAI8370736.1 ribosomal protein L23-domain-containing protein [Radiomyces spectabilis]